MAQTQSENTGSSASGESLKTPRKRGRKQGSKNKSTLAAASSGTTTARATPSMAGNKPAIRSGGGHSLHSKFSTLFEDIRSLERDCIVMETRNRST